MVSKEQMNEFTKFALGKEYGRISKSEYCQALMKLTYRIEQLKHIVYFRDLLYNPCHESERLNMGLSEDQ